MHVTAPAHFRTTASRLAIVAACAALVGPGCDDEPDADADADTDLNACGLVEDPVERPAPPERPDEVDYLIITQDRLAGPAREHAAYRDGRGHRAEVLTMAQATDDGAITDRDEMIGHLREIIRARREALDPARTMFVLILGGGGSDWRGSVYTVPPDEVGGWSWADGSPVTSDNSIADLDGDDVPDVAMGRITGREAADVEGVLERTRTLEAAYRPGPWNSRVHVFASEAGFGDIIDEMIEQAGFTAVREVPREWSFTFTYARAGSPYAYPPALFSDHVYELLNSGALMGIYIGHGSTGSIDDVRWGDEVAPILDTADLGQLDMTQRSSMLLLSACLTGAFDGEDSLAEAFLEQPGGPVAVLAATELSHPYPNGVLLRELAIAGLTLRRPTVGEVVLEAKRRMVANADDEIRVLLDTYAGIDPSCATPELRDELIRQHEHAYMLFGDPAHAVDYPAGTVEVRPEAAEIVGGEEIRACVQVHGPPSGHAVVTLETDRETIGHRLEDWEMDDPDRDEVVVANHALANDKVVESWEGDYEGGGFGVAFATETGRAGTLTLRVYVTSGDLDALGSAEVRVRRAQ